MSDPARAFLVQNPHDRLFKKILGSQANAIDFFQNYLPPEVLARMDLATLHPEEKSYVDESLRESYSDLLYSVSLKDSAGVAHDGFLYLLMEHKSTPDRFTALQLLHYMTMIWKSVAEHPTTDSGHDSRLLPMILPLVLYHGESAWRFGCDFSSLLDLPGEAFHKYAVNFEYHLWDLSAIPDTEIKGVVLTQTFLLILKHVRDARFHEKLPGILDLIVSLYNSDRTGLEDLRALLIYIFKAADRIDSREALQYIESRPVLKERIMPTIADLIGQEARLDGRTEGKLETARRMLADGLPVEKVLQYTGLSLDELRRAGMLQGDKPQD